MIAISFGALVLILLVLVLLFVAPILSVLGARESEQQARDREARLEQMEQNALRREEAVKLERELGGDAPWRDPRSDWS